MVQIKVSGRKRAGEEDPTTVVVARIQGQQQEQADVSIAPAAKRFCGSERASVSPQVRNLLSPDEAPLPREVGTSPRPPTATPSPPPRAVATVAAGVVASPRAAQMLPSAAQRPVNDAVDILNEWLLHHKHYPYPSTAICKQLQQQTGLSSRQVTNWLTALRKKMFPSISEYPYGGGSPVSSASGSPPPVAAPVSDAAPSYAVGPHLSRGASPAMPSPRVQTVRPRTTSPPAVNDVTMMRARPTAAPAPPVAPVASRPAPAPTSPMGQDSFFMMPAPAHKPQQPQPMPAAAPAPAPAPFHHAQPGFYGAPSNAPVAQPMLSQMSAMQQMQYHLHQMQLLQQNVYGGMPMGFGLPPMAAPAAPAPMAAPAPKSLPTLPSPQALLQNAPLAAALPELVAPRMPEPSHAAPAKHQTPVELFLQQYRGMTSQPQAVGARVY